jgi:TolB-like protein/Tfp pilus assembly protein PilF
MSEDSLKRRLAALLSADVVGYSRLMAQDELETVRTLTAYRERVTDIVRTSGGRVVDFIGDNMLAEFSSTLDAVECAVQIQQTLAEMNTTLADSRRMNFRIGIHLGDVMSDGERIYGDGVNIASRLESLAQPGGICISDMVYQQVHTKSSFTYIDQGKQSLKNIPEPMRVYRVVASDGTQAAGTAAAARISRPLLPLPAKPSLAVLPFVNLSADPQKDYFSDGLTIDIMTALVKIPGLFLISDASMFSYKSHPVSVQDLGRQLGVSHVLEGGIRRAGDRVRISARLTEIASGRQVWAERFDRKLDDLFDVQDEITEEIVTAMDVKLVSGEPGRTVRQTFKSPAALETYYRGWNALFSSSKTEIFAAQEMFEETIRLEPESPLGYALAAWAHWWAVFRDQSEDVTHSLKRATELARKALELEDVTGLPHLMMAQIHLSKREHEKALAESEQAVLARPSCDASYAMKAHILNFLGQPAEAIDLARHAIRLTPVYPTFYPAVLAAAYYGSGQYNEAAAAAEEVLASDRDNLDALLVLAGAQAALDQTDAARRAAHRVRRVKPDFTLEKFAAGQPYKDPQALDQVLAMLRKAGL